MGSKRAKLRTSGGHTNLARTTALRLTVDAFVTEPRGVQIDGNESSWERVLRKGISVNNNKFMKSLAADDHLHVNAKTRAQAFSVDLKNKSTRVSVMVLCHFDVRIFLRIVARRHYLRPYTTHYL